MRPDEIIALAAVLARPYRIVPPGVAAGGPAGVFAGRGDGQSVDFHDYRQYLPGDDLRRVDWRAYARSGQMQLKLFREEVSPVVELLLDTSGSMGVYPGKAETALFLAAFIKNAAVAVEGRPVLCRDGKRFAGGDFEAALADTSFSGVGDKHEYPVSGAGGRPLRFHVSDYMFDGGAASFFRRHAAGSLLFCPIMVLSRTEREPDWRGHCRLFDAEKPEDSLDLTLDESVVSAYRKRLHSHEESIDAEARRHGGRLVRLDVPDDGMRAEDFRELAARLSEERLVTAR